MNCAVVIVNWNGASDTLACLRSIFDGRNDVWAIVVDNGSTDRSLERLAEELATQGLVVECRDASATHLEPPPRAQVVLLAVGENLGFAAGSNVGLRMAAAAGSEFVCFLNNDTVVEGDALNSIVHRLATAPGCFATLPMLTVHGTDRIWNCGGEIWPIGLRRYHFAGRMQEEATRRSEIRCSFFTGCCFAVRTAAFQARGGFTERFFFGEEDFELALWMRERKLHAVCVTTAVVQHKVSASFEAASGSRAAARAFIYYLNRFIHMRLRLGTWRWRLWSAAYLPYVMWILCRNGLVSAGTLPAFIGRLMVRSRTMDSVTRADFEAVMANQI